MKRSIIIGDIHGCIDELNELLEKVAFQPESDVVYCVGDFINRGPDSRAVFSRLMEIRCQSILGNHELYLKRKIAENHKPSILRCQAVFKDDYQRFVNYLFKLPIYIEKKNFIIVHAGIDPREKINSQSETNLTSIRFIQPKNELETMKPWFEFYTGEKLIIFGHWAQLEGVERKNVIGLDTGCVYGKKLSAIVMPECKVVTVDAKQVYCPIK